MTAPKRPPPLAYPGAQQTDLAQDPAVTCPTCGGPWKAAKRVCRRCGQAIGRSERWHTIPAGPGLWAIEHRGECPNASKPGVEERPPAYWFGCQDCGFRVTEIEFTSFREAVDCPRCGRGHVIGRHAGRG